MRVKILSYLASLIFIALASTSNGQTQMAESPKTPIGIEGMLGFSMGNNFYSVNVGGPALFLVLNDDWKIGVGALPSIYSLNGKLGARLGVAPRIDHKNLVFFAPFFHRDRTDEWIWSVGFGYKFHRKKPS